MKREWRIYAAGEYGRIYTEQAKAIGAFITVKREDKDARLEVRVVSDWVVAVEAKK